jgi:magnesium chelatase family protein
MSLAIVHSRALVGIDAPPVTVEVHLTNGLPALSIVGLPEAAVRESKDRVRSAILNAKFEFPRKRITINLAPADLPKEGGRYDLAIALGILAASGQVPANALEEIEFLGELALSGKLRPVSGVLPASIACEKAQRKLCVAKQNASEAAMPKHAQIVAGNSLLEICAHLFEKADLSFHKTFHETSEVENQQNENDFLDLNEVKGQQRAKRALEIAAAGSHNLLFIGPPGTGKTMLATRLPTLLPALTEEEAIEVASVYSIHQKQGLHQQWKKRPCRSPHHTASAVALVGGGSTPKPGEISLAHHGVLFLDEFPEFDRKVLEVLREPLESGEIHISRATQQVQFPANFQLIAAMNPCPCGYYGDGGERCSCTLDQVQRYKAKLSGPLLDRIDLHVEVALLDKRLFFEEKQNKSTSENTSSAHIRKKVCRARQQQITRQNKNNADLNNRGIEAHCEISQTCKVLLSRAMETLNFSPRAYHRILKVARTIADLAESEGIEEQHIAEAISFRGLDRG